MGTTLQIDTTVQPDGTIQVHAPGLVPGQRVRVAITPAKDDQERTGPAVIDLITTLPGHQIFQSSEEVDAYILEERESWER